MGSPSWRHMLKYDCRYLHLKRQGVVPTLGEASPTMPETGGAWRRGAALGVGGVDGGFVADRHSPVPTAVAFLLLDASVVTGLVARVSEVRQHVCPQALVLGGDEAGQVVAGFDLQTHRKQHRISLRLRLDQ